MMLSSVAVNRAEHTPIPAMQPSTPARSDERQNLRDVDLRQPIPLRPVVQERHPIPPAGLAERGQNAFPRRSRAWSSRLSRPSEASRFINVLIGITAWSFARA
jgi:hypothetical protein